MRSYLPRMATREGGGGTHEGERRLRGEREGEAVGWCPGDARGARSGLRGEGCGGAFAFLLFCSPVGREEEVAREEGSKEGNRPDNGREYRVREEDGEEEGERDGAEAE